MRKRAPSIKLVKPRPRRLTATTKAGATRAPVRFPVPPEWHQVPDDVRAAVRDLLKSIVRRQRQLRVLPPA